VPLDEKEDRSRRFSGNQLTKNKCGYLVSASG